MNFRFSPGILHYLCLKPTIFWRSVLSDSSFDIYANRQTLTQLPFLTRLRITGRLAGIAIGLVWGASRTLTIAIFTILVMEAAMPPLILWLASGTIDSIASDQASRFGTTTWIVLTVVALLLSQLLGPILRVLKDFQSDKLTAYAGDRIIAAVNHWPGASRFEDPKTRDDLTLANNRAISMGVDLMGQAAPLVGFFLSVITYAATLTILHPLAPILIIAFTLPQLINLYEFENAVGSHLSVQIPFARRMDYDKHVPRIPEDARDYRLFNLGPKIEDHYQQTWRRVVTEMEAIRLPLTRQQIWTTGLGQLVSAIVAVYAIHQAAAGEISIGQVTLLLGAIAGLTLALQQIGSAFGYVPQILSFLPSLERILDAPPDLPLAANPAQITQPINQGIAFEHVSFSYPGTTRKVLEDISFSLAPDEALALVGHNGAGKTTLLKLMLRLYDPDEGRITLDGIDVREYDPARLREVFGVVFQDFDRYDLTLRENVAIGSLHTQPDDQAILEALRRAGGAEIVTRLSDGLDTLLGHRFGGRELSGGEWQKVALARAFVRDAPILILDEPTAALDVRAEYELYQRFADLTQDRATILVSHRFSTVRMADRILVLDGAHIVEEGSHTDLMRKDGLYASLYTAQAEHYVDAPADQEVQA